MASPPCSRCCSRCRRLLPPPLLPAAAADSLPKAQSSPGACHACRQSVVQAPWQIEAEQKKQEALAAVLAAPKPEHAEGGEGGDGAGPAAMEGMQQGGDAAMAVDGQPE